MDKKPVIALLLAFLALSLVGCASGSQNAPTPTPLPQLLNTEKIVFTVERGPIISQREVAGEVVTEQQDELFFRTTGYVTRVLVKNGDLFKKGDVLAELQVDDLLDQLQQAQIDLQVSQTNADNEKLQKAYDIQQAESEVTIWQKQVDVDKSRLEKADAAQQEEAQLNLDIAQERLKTAQAYLTLIKGKVNTDLEQTVQRNQLNVEHLQRLVTDRQVIAPYDGIVIHVSLTVGTQVDAFSTVIWAGDPTHLVIRVPYDYELTNTLDVNTPAYLYGKTKDVKYAVSFIPDFLPVSNVKKGISTDQSGTITVNYLYFSVPENLPSDQIPVGSRANLLVVLGSKEDALLLPPAAIRGNDQFQYVIVLEDNTHRRVEVVSVGVKTADKWEVTANLKEGDQVLGP